MWDYLMCHLSTKYSSQLISLLNPLNHLVNYLLISGPSNLWEDVLPDDHDSCDSFRRH